MTKIPIQYIAGYTDGDGCFHIQKYASKSGSVKYMPRFIISSVNPKILQDLAKEFNGALKIADKRSKYEGQKPQYHFYLGGRNCLPLVEKMLPFLIEKHAEAKAFYFFLKSQKLETKEVLRLELKELKHKVGLISLGDKEWILKSSLTWEPTGEDFVYLAGFIDAECCLCLNRYTRKNTPNFIYKAILRCNNTKSASIKWLVQRFGGQLSFINRKEKNPNHRDQLMWTLSSKSLFKILPKVFPYLKHKNPAANELLKFFETKVPDGDRQSDEFRTSYSAILKIRDQIFHKLHLLNRKGI